MAFVHPQSCECLKSELDLFSVPPTQTSIESGSFVEYNPIAALSDNTAIEFAISGSGQDYCDLASSQLFVRVEITKANGAALDATSQVGPVNLLLHSLFADVDIKLNEISITNSNNTYPYRAYLETLLSYGPAAKNSQLTAALYYKDTAGAMEDKNPLLDTAQKGLKTRHSFFKEGKVVDLIGCLHSDLFFQDRYLPCDVGLRIKLLRSKDSFCLMSGQAAYKIKIHECKFYMRKVKLSSSVFVAHAKALEEGNAKYPIRRVVCKTFTIPTGNLDFTQENVFAGTLPTRLVIGLVDNSAYNGNYELNPFNFRHYDLNQLKVVLDGQQQHYISPLEPNFTAQRYVEAYMSLFTGTGKNTKDEGTDITRTDFAAGYAIYAFDLTPDMSEDTHFNLSRDGSVRLEMKFGTALPNTVNVVVYAEFEHVIEINRDKQVIFDFAT